MVPSSKQDWVETILPGTLRAAVSDKKGGLKGHPTDNEGGNYRFTIKLARVNDGTEKNPLIPIMVHPYETVI